MLLKALEEIAASNPHHHEAFELFLTMGLPTKGKEEYSYYPLSTLYSHEVKLAKEDTLSHEKICSFVEPSSLDSYLVFVNGRYHENLSNISGIDDKIVVLPLDVASTRYSSFLNNRIEKNIEKEKDPFALLNYGLGSSGVFIYVPPQVLCEKKIHCLYFTTPQEEMGIAFPRIHIFVGKHSSVHCIRSHIDLGETPQILSAVIDVALEERGECRLSLCAHSEKGWFFEAVRSTLKRGSQFKTASLNTGSLSSREDYHVQLLEEGSEASLKGLGYYKGNKKGHVHVRIDHEAENCTSRQLFKNVLFDQSRSSFAGKITVIPIAQRTNAYQLNQNLLLGEHALCYSKPNLEIFADDVKASHGSTTGQLDSKELFYLMARGLSKDEAKTLLIKGFCAEILEEIPSGPCLH